MSPTNISRMNQFRLIRERLKVTQAVLAENIGVTQGNVSFYERGQTVPPSVAGRLIEYARTLGHSVSYDDLYGAPAQGDVAQQAA